MAEERTEEKNFVNWEKLATFPAYEAAVMRPNPEYESSILGIMNGNVITPICSYEDTVKDKDSFAIALRSKQFARKDNGKELSLTTRMMKDDFTRIMLDCVRSRPKKYTWEHPDFDKVLNACITQFADYLNSENVNDLFARTNKEYCLSNGVGQIFNSDIVSGAFSGIKLTAKYSGSNGITIKMEIPRLLHNAAIGNFSESNLVYTDKEKNLKIQIGGSNFRRNTEGEGYVAEVKRSSVTISKLRDDCIILPQDPYANIETKKLYIPMTKLDFRFMNVAASIGKDVTIEPTVPLERMLNRFKTLRR